MDSKLSYRLSIAGLLFLPLAVLSYFLSRDLIVKGHDNRFSRLSFRVSRFGIGLGIFKLLMLAITRNIVLD